MPLHEMKTARNLARNLGVPHRVIATREMELPEFMANPPHRCYVCKKERFSQVLALARKEGYAWVAEGTNRDDFKDYRPGQKAQKELGTRSPLAEAGFTKGEIRMLSRTLALPNWDKPASACLASRIPYENPITREKLVQIEKGEKYIRKLGLAGQVRVRHHKDTARIELEPAAFAGLLNPLLRKRLIATFKRLGFQFVTLDLEGYNMGSLNRALKERK
jgi:uncharacterized protein